MADGYETLPPTVNMSSSTNNFITMASARYPINDSMSPDERHKQMERREDYIFALEECKANPAYQIRLPTGDMWPCLCEPLMEDDMRGWTTIKRKVRVHKGFTDEELDAEENTDHWDDIVHQGRVTYTGPTAYEHNGSLFDLGSRF
jgi:hypothetical protein